MIPLILNPERIPKAMEPYSRSCEFCDEDFEHQEEVEQYCPACEDMAKYCEGCDDKFICSDAVEADREGKYLEFCESCYKEMCALSEHYLNKLP